MTAYCWRRPAGPEVRQPGQARGYQIGGHANGTVSLFLESQGIRTSNSLNDAENLRKLLTGRIDLWAVADPVWRYFARQQGVEEGQLQVALSFRSEPLYGAESGYLRCRGEPSAESPRRGDRRRLRRLQQDTGPLLPDPEPRQDAGRQPMSPQLA